MAKLVYKTKDSAYPTGRPRVYFACHPDDFAATYERFCEELFCDVDCVIWHDEEPLAPYDREQWEDDLSQMQLFVIPITTNFLTKPCRALEIEFAFAISHHIPVLPIMCESGLSSLFSQKCGTLQYLDPDDANDKAHGVGALPYEEKRKRFLQSVLLGDEQTKSIQQAFDAYVFLSYRKKDRAHARKLMRLIHERDFCRDVAIWYDEYLTPGEDFNSAIQEALQKSEVFALAVTPNLVNEENYVQTQEYPQAIQSKKSILPVELVPTDSERLKEQYQNIPPVIDPDDKMWLTQALTDSLHAAALRKSADPTHDFFIGLAYLNGIDVEVDVARARSLITSAANGGVREAAQRLAVMYENGEGVARDARQAIPWRKRVVVLSGKQYRACPNEETARQLFGDFKDLGDAYRDLGDLTAAKRSYQKQLSIAKQYGWMKDMSLSFARLGEVSKLAEQPNSCKRYYKKALAIDEELTKNEEDLTALRNLSVGYSDLGRLARECDRLGEAAKYFKKSLAIDERLRQRNICRRTTFDVMASLSGLGNIAEKRGKLPVAEKYYKSALTLCQTLQGGSLEVELRKAEIYLNLTQLALDNKKLVQAESLAKQALSCLQIVQKSSSAFVVDRTLSLIYDILAEIMTERGDSARCEKYLLLSVKVCEDLASRCDLIAVRSKLSQSYNKLAVHYLDNEFVALADGIFQKALALRLGIAQEAPAMSAKIQLAYNYHRSAEICEAQRRSGDAIACDLQALALWEELYKTRRSYLIARNLGLAFEILGKRYCAQKDFAQAAEYLALAYERKRRIYEKSPTLDARCDIGVYYESQARFCLQMGNYVGAKRYFDEMMTVFQGLFDELGTREAKIDLVLGGRWYGEYCLWSGETSASCKVLERALRSARELLGEGDTVTERKTLVSVAVLLARAYLLSGDIPAAKQVIADVRQVAEELYCQKQTKVTKALYADVLTVQGQQELAEAQLQQARSLLTQAVLLRQEIAAVSDFVDDKTELLFATWWQAVANADEDEQHRVQTQVQELLAKYPRDERLRLLLDHIKNN